MRERQRGRGGQNGGYSVAMWDSCDESECRELNSTRTTANRAKPEMFEPTELGKVSGTFLSFRLTNGAE